MRRTRVAAKLAVRQSFFMNTSIATFVCGLIFVMGTGCSAAPEDAAASSTASAYTDGREGSGACLVNGPNVSSFVGLSPSGRDEATIFSAAIYVHNLGYRKNVGIVFTTDHWATSHVETAHYDSVPYGCVAGEMWTVGAHQILPPGSYDPSPGGLRLEYAAFYDDLEHGETYWDNNGGNNYVAKVE